jgi:4-aminobutyrate aminotransferase-like enzyme
MIMLSCPCYSDFVKRKVEELVLEGRPPSAFIAEPLEGNAGGVCLPPGYLKQVYNIIREVGGLCICDEVQMGYGRLGNVFWGFEEHDVVPDILTMAKAAGNGHPLGFVLVSEDIVREFSEAQGSFFSSAGGGPVSCVIGSTILRLIKEENLQENALEVGNYLHERLIEVQQRHPDIIGYIHGHGLYQGIELVRNYRYGKNDLKPLIPEPATKEAYSICERMLELGVICHNTGDFSNVIKMKPPLCITKEDVEFFAEALDIACSGW